MIYLFHTIDFLFFFLAVFASYWAVPKNLKNSVLLIASYIFYAAWNWKLLSLLFVTTWIDYFCGLKIHAAKSQGERKLFLVLSIAVHLALLGFFKYFNFFVENMVALLNSLGLHLNYTTLNILLPLGISFYTFQAMSYTIDIYRKKFVPIRSMVDFSLFIAYFPQLIAGPIERATELIPRIQEPKLAGNISVREGIYLFIYGLFKKIVIADTVAVVVSQLFTSPAPSGSQVVLATYAFALQVYADFSGYTDMARGISLFFGIRLSRNFNLPFFAKDPSDFFKRWHITLSKWITDYVYLPLFFYLPRLAIFRKTGSSKKRFYASGIVAAFVTMVIFGLWHGAAWNFLFMGVFLFTAIMAFKLVKAAGKALPWPKQPETLWAILRIFVTFHVIWYVLLFTFRSERLAQIAQFTKSLMAGIAVPELFQGQYWYLYVSMAFLVGYEALQYLKKDELFICRQNFYAQMAFYLTLFFIAVNIGAVTNVAFVYFQF